MFLQLEDGKVSHGIALLVGALGGKVFLEDGDVVRVVSVDAINERLDDLWASGRGAAGHGDGMLCGGGSDGIKIEMHVQHFVANCQLHTQGIRRPLQH
jgi:hypothetical protein